MTGDQVSLTPGEGVSTTLCGLDALGRAVRLGPIHALVDATTVTVVFRVAHGSPISPQMAFALILAYDILAFGAQVPFGWITDRWGTPKRATLMGLGLTLASVCLGGLAPIPAIVIAGVGNAFFHLGAGAAVLRGGLSKAFPAGVFVAPGALGLGFGLFYGPSLQAGPTWPLGLLVALALAVVWIFGDRMEREVTEPFRDESSAPVRRSNLTPALGAAFALLMVSIAVRSLVGFAASRGVPRTTELVVGIPLAAFLGKSLGGYLADRWGWLETTVVALLVSALLLGWVGERPMGLLPGLFVFQMTMPVTLTAVAKIFPNRLGTAFGWTCLALILGALPTMIPAGAPLCSRELLVGWILVSTVAVAAGLFLLGFGRRRALGRFWSPGAIT